MTVPRKPSYVIGTSMAFLEVPLPISSKELLIVSTARTSAYLLLCASTEDQMFDPGPAA